MIISESEIKNIIIQTVEPSDINLAYKIENAANQIHTEILLREFSEAIDKMEKISSFNKGDEIVIEGIKFRVKYDFNSDYDKHLLLKIVRDESKTYEGKRL